VSIEDQPTPVGRPLLVSLPSTSIQRKMSALPTTSTQRRVSSVSNSSAQRVMSCVPSSSAKTLPALNPDIKTPFKSSEATITPEEDTIINDISKVMSVKYNELLAELKKADPLHSGLVCNVKIQLLCVHAFMHAGMLLCMCGKLRNHSAVIILV